MRFSTLCNGVLRRWCGFSALALITFCFAPSLFAATYESLLDANKLKSVLPIRNYGTEASPRGNCYAFNLINLALIHQLTVNPTASREDWTTELGKLERAIRTESSETFSGYDSVPDFVNYYSDRWDDKNNPIRQALEAIQVDEEKQPRQKPTYAFHLAAERLFSWQKSVSFLIDEIGKCSDSPNQILSGENDRLSEITESYFAADRAEKNVQRDGAKEKFDEAGRLADCIRGGILMPVKLSLIAAEEQNEERLGHEVTLVGLEKPFHPEHPRFLILDPNYPRKPKASLELQNDGTKANWFFSGLKSWGAQARVRILWSEPTQKTKSVVEFTDLEIDDCNLILASPGS